MQELRGGFIHVYTGNGKGKTTAALGQALRASGSGLKTFFVQFMKNFPYGEIRGVRHLTQWITLEQWGDDAFVLDRRIPTPGEMADAEKGLERAREAMNSGEYEIVILDEICVAIHFGLLKTETLMRFLDEKPAGVELILTGRYCPPELIERADLVTEMKEVKHYYQKGVMARKGIEC